MKNKNKAFTDDLRNDFEITKGLHTNREHNLDISV